MKAVHFLIALTCTVSTLAAGQEGRSMTPVLGQRGQEVLDVEYAWAAATKARDSSRVARILAAEWYLLGPYGKVISRAGMLAAVHGNSDRIDSTVYFDVRIQVFDTIAIATGGADEIGTRGNGARYSEPYRWLDVFVYRERRWQALVSQATFIAGPAR